MSLNPKFIFFLTLILVFAGFAIITHYEKVNADEAQKIIDAQNALALSNKNDSFAIITTPEPEPTGTPYLMYSPQPIRIDNSLDIGKFFNWKQDNVSGYQTMNISSTMYGYTEFSNFTYYDYNWGKSFDEFAPDGKEYFMVYIYTLMDDVNGGDDSRMWLPHQNQYGLLINDVMYYPIVFDYEHNQINKMDEVYNYQHVERIKPYGYEYVIAPDNETKVNTYQMMEKDWLIGGKSNAEDGYIIFQIPKDYNKKLLRLHANFFSFGSATWKIV